MGTVGMNRSSAIMEDMARTLEESGQFRVLRRLERRPMINAPDGSVTRLGMFVDVETTGLDPMQDEIIELAIVPFSYSLDGRVFDIHEPFARLHQPEQPIPDDVIALTGITNEMVAGQKVDAAEVAAILEPAALVIAHNADFDRRFLERAFPCFAAKPWACSMTQVDWSADGFDGTKLSYLVSGAGFFYERHRASHDCLAAIELLAKPLPRAGVPALARLLENARKPTWRIWAENSPFELKGLLKARGYKWNGDRNPRAWYVDIDEDMKEQELDFLRRDIYVRDVDLPMKRVTALERFSDRS